MVASPRVMWIPRRELTRRRTGERRLSVTMMYNKVLVVGPTAPSGRDRFVVDYLPVQGLQ